MVLISKAILWRYSQYVIINLTLDRTKEKGVTDMTNESVQENNIDAGQMLSAFFTGEEMAAIKEQIPMTLKLFLSIMKKCEEIGDDARPIFLKMLDEDKYEHFLDVYEEQIPWNISDELRKQIDDFHNRELTEDEMGGFMAFVTEAVCFTEEQNNAIDQLIPMTQEIFNGIIDKCNEIGSVSDDTFFRVIEEYPDFAKAYADAKDGEMEKNGHRTLTAKEWEELDRKVYERIRSIRG